MRKGRGVCSGKLGSKFIKAGTNIRLGNSIEKDMESAADVLKKD